MASSMASTESSSFSNLHTSVALQSVDKNWSAATYWGWNPEEVTWKHVLHYASDLVNDHKWDNALDLSKLINFIFSL